jgi:hypothetical protein
VGGYTWILVDEGGDELRAVEGFGSQDEAERWLTETWESLAQQGAESVRLATAGEIVFEMRLGPE